MSVFRNPSTISRLLVAATLCARSSVAAAEDASFLRDVAPLLLQRCSGCHGSSKVEGGYRLHTFQFLLRAGDSEEPAIQPGRPNESELFRRITSADDSSRMPQLDDPLSSDEVDLIRRWIAAGAKFDGRDPHSPFKSQLPPRTHAQPPEAYPLPVPVQAIAFSPDGRELACSGHHEVTIWNAEDGRLVRRVGHLPEQVHAINWLKDGRSLVVAGGTPGEYGEVSIVNSDGSGVPRVLGTFDDLVLSAAVSHDNSLVVATSADRNDRCYRFSDGALQWESRLHSDWVTSSAFSSDDRFVATGSRDLTIKVLDAATGALFTTYNGHQQQLGPEKGRFQIHAMASGEGLGMFSAGEGRSIRAWDLEKAREENGSAADMEIRFYKAGHTKFIRHESKQSIFGLVASGSTVFAATGDGVVLQFDAVSQKLIRSYPGLADQALAVAVHAPSGRMAAAAFDGGIRVWNVATGELATSFLAAPGIAAVALAPSSKPRPKKLIEWGWDEPDTAFLRANIETMEQFPFDGLVFHAQTDKGANLAWEVWGDKKFADTDFKQAVDDLKATKFDRFTDRFLRVNVTPGKVDWFDDEAWASVLNNFSVAARVAREGRCKGFMFDTEQYDGAVTLFDYRQQQHKDGKSFAEYQAIVRQRGREWMQSVNRPFPDITILMTFGYEMSFRRAEKPGDRSTAPYGLLADFLDGVLEAAAAQTVLVDAWEFSYPYKERQQFEDAYQIITQKALTQTAAPEQYKRHVQAGFGLWMDHRRKDWDVVDFSKNHFTPAEFESAVRSALDVSDEYVWIYTERPRWWSNEMLPQAYVDAVSQARKNAE